MRSTRTSRIVVAVALAGALALSALGDRVERRGHAGILEGTVTRVGDDGVEITTALEARHLVSWDRVRSVESARHAQRIAEMMPIADALWRGRSRVERGDMLLAEPPLARLFERYRGQSNETALVVAEGLLRCRVSRGDQALAVVAALEVARLRRLGVSTDSYAALPPIIDETTLLCPLLPPLLPEGPGLEQLRAETIAFADPVILAMAEAYRAAPSVRRDGTLANALPLALPMGEAAEHPGVRLLVGAVRAAEPTVLRRALIDALQVEARSLPPFAAAWVELVDGLALVDDPDPSVARRGVVRLLGVRSGHARRQPWLAGSALLIAAATEARVGDPVVAGILQRELQGSFSHHPLVAAPLRRRETFEESS